MTGFYFWGILQAGDLYDDHAHPDPIDPGSKLCFFSLFFWARRAASPPRSSAPALASPRWCWAWRWPGSPSSATTSCTPTSGPRRPVEGLIKGSIGYIVAVDPPKDGVSFFYKGNTHQTPMHTSIPRFMACIRLARTIRAADRRTRPARPPRCSPSAAPARPRAPRRRGPGTAPRSRRTRHRNARIAAGGCVRLGRSAPSAPAAARGHSVQARGTAGTAAPSWRWCLAGRAPGGRRALAA